MKPARRAMLFLLLLTATINRATSIAIIRTDNQIVMAADSMRTYAEAGEQRTFQYCKIHVAGKLVFAVDGIARDDKDSLDVVKTTADVLAEGGSFKANVHRIVDRLNKPLLLALRRAYQTMPSEQYAQFVPPMEPNLALGIAGVVNGVLTFAVIDFTKQDDASGAPINVGVKVSYCPGKDCNSNYRILGFKKAANQRIGLGGFFTSDHVADARNIIRIEINAAPGAVGPPISIVTIDSKGVHWVERGVCHD
jgi:hypothetical protein